MCGVACCCKHCSSRIKKNPLGTFTFYMNGSHTFFMTLTETIQTLSQRNVEYDEHTAALLNRPPINSAQSKEDKNLPLYLSLIHPLSHFPQTSAPSLFTCHSCWTSNISPQSPVLSLASISGSIDTFSLKRIRRWVQSTQPYAEEPAVSSSGP